MTETVEPKTRPSWRSSVAAQLSQLWRLGNALLLHRRGAFVALAVLVFASTLAEAFGIATVMPLVAALQGLPPSSSRFLGWAPNAESWSVMELAILVAAAFLVKNALVLIRLRFSHAVLFGLWEEWLRRIVDNVVLAPVDRRDEQRSGRLIATALVETRESVRVLFSALELLVSVLTLGCIYAVLWIATWEVTLVLTAIFVVGLVTGLRPLSRAAHVAGRRAVIAYESASNQLLEILGGLPYIKAFGTEGRVREEMHRAGHDARIAFESTRWIAGFLHPLVETTLVVFLTISIIIFGRSPTTQLSDVLPVLGMFTAAAFRIFPVLTGLGRQWVAVVGKQTSMRTVVNNMEAVTRERTGGRRFEVLERGIVLRDIDYRYPTRTERALSGVTLDLTKARKSILVGESGSGKSTIVSLLLGFREPNAGGIEVDGAPLAEINLASWRSAIGYVGQDGFIFHSTLEENITLGREARVAGDLEAAIRAVGLEELIETLPDGRDTVVGERGAKLSGGQQQRVALARAVFRRPQILILDEALNALDNESAFDVIEAISDLLPETTWIVVGHRLSTSVAFDSIFVLREGLVVERGTHAELIERDGYYRKLFEKEGAASQSGATAAKAHDALAKRGSS